MFAGQDRRSCRRTDGTGSVGIGEPHTLAGESVEVRRFMEIAAVAGKISPAKIIREDEDNVWSLLIFIRSCQGRADEQNYEQKNQLSPCLHFVVCSYWAPGRLGHGFRVIYSFVPINDSMGIVANSPRRHQGFSAIQDISETLGNFRDPRSNVERTLIAWKDIHCRQLRLGAAT